MADAIWVPVNAEMRGFVATMIKTASGAAKTAGKNVSDEMGKAGEQAGQNLADGLASQARRIEQISTKVATARKAEATQAAAVLAAEQELNTLRNSASATASQLSAAEEKVATAKSRQSNAAETLARNERDLESVRAGGEATSLALARAEDALANAKTAASQAIDKMRTAELRLDEVKSTAAQRSDAVAAAEIKLMDVRDRYGANTKETAAAEKQLEAAKKQLETANMRVAKEEGKVITQRADLTSKTETARAKTAVYEAVQKDVADAQKRAGDEADRAGGKIAILGDEAAGADSKFSGLAKSALGTVTAFAGVAGLASLGSMGMEVAGSISEINRQLGYTGVEASVVSDGVSAALRGGVASSAEEAAAAIGAIESQWKYLGSEGEQTAAQLSDNFLAFSKTFGVDVAEATQTAGQLLINGLAPDVETATDLMAAAMQRVPAQMRDELPEIINEYGVHFANMGMSGEESFNLLVSAAERGKWALDKTGDAVKEFSIRGSDMSKTSVEAYDLIGLSAEEMATAIATGGADARSAMEQTAQGLLGIEDPAARANAAVALFGTPIEDLAIDQIPMFLESLAGAENMMGDFQGASQAIADQMANSLPGRINALKGTIQDLAADGFMFAWDTALKLKDLLEQYKTPLTIAAGLASSLALGMAAVALQQKIVAAGGFVKWVSQAARGMGIFNLSLLANPLTWIVAGLVAATAGIVWFFTQTETGQNIWSGFMDVLRGAGSWLMDTLGPAFEWVGEKATAAFTWIKDAASGLWDLFVNGDFTSTLGEALGISEDSAIVDWMFRIRDGAIDLKDRAGEAFEWLAEKWSEFTTGFGQFYDTWIRPTVDLFVGQAQVLGGMVGQVFTFLIGLWGQVGNIFSTIWSSQISVMWIAMQAGGQILGAVLSGIFRGIIVPAFEFIGTMIMSVWTNIIQPVWGFFSSATGLLADVLTGNFGNIGNRFREMGQHLLDIVMGPINVGFDYFRGLLDMIKSGWTSFQDTVTNVVSIVVAKGTEMVTNIAGIPERIRSVFADAGEWLKSAGRNIMSGLWSGIQQGFENVRDWLTDLPSRIRSSVGGGGNSGARSGGSASANATGAIHENHVAQIASGGQLRLWAEPETGGEAYIPLAPGKRDRSMAILHEVAQRFGVTLVDSSTGALVGPAYQGNLGPQDVMAFADGGIITGDDLMAFVQGQAINGSVPARPLEGAPYGWGGSNWGDCSATVSSVAALADGQIAFPRKFATGTEASWLLSHGFSRGRGDSGDLRIGMRDGGPGGGHTSATLPNGVNIEMGGGRGNGQVGGNAAGAHDSYYNEFFYRPMQEQVWATPEIAGLSDLSDSSVPSTKSAAVTATVPATAATSAAQSVPLTPEQTAQKVFWEEMGSRSLGQMAFDAGAAFFGVSDSLVGKYLFTPVNELFGVSSKSENLQTSTAQASAEAINDQALQTLSIGEIAADPQLNGVIEVDPWTGSRAELSSTLRGEDVGYGSLRELIGEAPAQQAMDVVYMLGQAGRSLVGTLPAPMRDVFQQTGLYDEGGWLGSGELAFNATPKREPMAVFNDRQWTNLESLANMPSGDGGGDVTVVVNLDGQEVLRRRVSRAEEKIEINSEEIEELKDQNDSKITDGFGLMV